MGGSPGRISRGYFAAADVFVHASRIEAAGYVLLEAMAAGLPVVCTDAGGPAEYVANDVAGFVVPVADPAAMAERVLLLLRNTELRERLGRQARERRRDAFQARTHDPGNPGDVSRPRVAAFPIRSSVQVHQEHKR